MSPDYKIDIPHFYCLEYREGDRVLQLDIDFRDPMIYLEEKLVTNWQEPHSDEKIPSAEKKRILDNVYGYLIRQGFNFVDYKR